VCHLGFPIAEVHQDGSSVITKHEGTGGAVTVGTVTAQLLYEITGPRYLGPDVTARMDTVELSQVGADRVPISKVRGEAPPPAVGEWGSPHHAGIRVRSATSRVRPNRHDLEVLYPIKVANRTNGRHKPLDQRNGGRGVDHRRRVIQGDIPRTAKNREWLRSRHIDIPAVLL
jgi:hypothetical protein